ncbi:hypothetical protein BO83DRAFT_393125 [Aspergillus eucalypticola CBS 122712]|uniref:HNH nuclease domain-containing protein n=1 Tax=Aspergillus eucalypticola (strain CBS 122712 / IBT 29274) TaxID=1448314 RepID=A0A317UTI3_ASPEC|nr:uncharacterized protein BO83DRAFT_393125 [Aspergillus eucalypticola CBS 122712]PWY63837.1 hypothetical protein BO83DRAFT_393125 [Aspergillus eucalypticola CBS 122712]
MDLFQNNKSSLTFRTSKRLALFKGAFQEPGNDEKEKVPRCVWAILLVCEMKLLDGFIKWWAPDGHKNRDTFRIMRVLKEWTNTTKLFIANVYDGSVDEKNTTIESDSDDDVCSTIMANVRERDADKCVITSQSTSMLCDICPDHLLQELSFHKFWAELYGWWKIETVKRWKQPLFPNFPHIEAVETIQNYISLSPVLRKYWEWGDFVLRPHPDHRERLRELKVQVFWLTLQDHCWSDKICVFSKPPRIRKGTTVKLIGFESEELKDLKSGDWITLTTPDPERLPLPSWDLLEFRFIMTIFARFAGKIVPEEGCNQEK